MQNQTLSRVSDTDLVAALTRLSGAERDSTVALIRYTAEFDRRRLYRGLGFSSMFGYCCAVLRLSEHESYSRIQAARSARKFPEVLALLAAGSVNLTTIRLLAPHLTAENHRDLLGASVGKGKREVEELLARQFPQPAVPSSVRKLRGAGVVEPSGGTPTPPGPMGSVLAVSMPDPLPSGPAVEGANEGGSHQRPCDPVAASPSTAPAAAPPVASQRPTVTPLAEDRYQVRFTATSATLEKLKAAQDLLRHRVPSGDVALIFDQALDALLEALAKQRVAATEKPRPSRGVSPGSRHIPAEVKRAVWKRDREQCAFVSAGGRRCKERGALEFHHVRPYAAGGEATVENIELRCRSHNQYESELFYGPGLRGYDVARECYENSFLDRVGTRRGQEASPTACGIPRLRTSDTARGQELSPWVEGPATG